MSPLIKGTSEKFNFYVSDVPLSKFLVKIISKFANENLCDKPLIKENQ